MVGKKKSEITDYMMWSKAVTRYAKIFIFGICILVVSFAVGLIVLDKTSVVFLASTIAIVIWCGSAYLILRKMLKAKESLRTAARTSLLRTMSVSQDTLLLDRLGTTSRRLSARPQVQSK